MVGSRTPSLSAENNRIEIERAQLAATLALLMLTALAAPSLLSISAESQELAEEPTRFPTANGTIDDSDAQTLLTNLNANNPIDVMGVMDDSNRIHLVWIENTSTPLLRYALIQISTGVDTILISTTQVGGSNATSLSSPSMVVDSQGQAHIVWEITDTDILYTLLDPSQDDQDGSAGDIQNMTIVSHTVADGTGTRNSPDIAVDSFDAVHIVWVDTYDPQGLYFGSPLIYYCMLAYDSNNGFQVLINSTMVTPALGHRGSPAVSIGANNTVVIVWEDTRGSIVEYVGLIDSSGSMTTEWEDMCAVFYGGNMTSGQTFTGIKPMLEQANITVLETLYALSGQMSYASSHKNCEDGYIAGGSGSEGPRTTSLGQNASDTTGGIRSLGEVMYNNSNLTIPTDWSYNSEMWGPGSTWACLSWRDNSGMTPGNPATAFDHQWNPNATKLVIPVADEGPYGGSGNGHQAQDADDYQSISEAHDACVSAGIIPIAVAGTLSYGPSSPWGNDTHVRSHMMDLVQCAGNTTGIHERTCDDSAVNTTDAGGDMFLYPTDNMANFEGDFESGYFTNGWGVSGTSYNTWHVEAGNNGNIYSQANLCDIGGTTGNPSFYSVSCNYTQPAGVTVDLRVTVDNWASEFSMDVILPDGTVASFNSSTVYNYYSGILVSFTGAGNYTIYLNDSYGDGGTSVSADYSYVSGSAPSTTPISGVYSARSGDISDNDSTNLEFTGVMSDGTVSFAYNISTEANFDFLTFSIDGIQLAQWSGSQSGNFSTPVSLGQHTLKWTYVKDGSVSVDHDAVWIDDVIIPLANYTEEMQALVQSIIQLTTGAGATNTFLTVLNPYSILSNPRSTWSVGDSGHTIDESTGQYQEDIGPDTDWYWREDGGGWDTLGHLVLVNDTQISQGHGWAVNPEVNVDDDGNIHVVWIDGKSEFPSKEGPSQLHYMQLDPDRQGALDGEPNGLVLDEVTTVKNTAVLHSNLIWGANPRVDFDHDGSIHITWFETQESVEDTEGVVELRWTRIQSPVMNGFEQLPLNRYLTQAYSVVNTRTITSSSQNLMGVFGSEFDASAQPIVKFAWPERTIAWTANDCTDEESVANKWDVCMWSEDLYDMSLDLHPTETGHVTIQPDQSIEVAMNLRGIQIPGEVDIVSIDVEGVLDNWDITAGFGENYHPTSTIAEGNSEEVYLLIQAPDIRLVNEDQSFDVIVRVQSTTDQFATTEQSVSVNLVNDKDWNDDDQDGILDQDDLCQFGETGWQSSAMTDYDGDGCRDETEDIDDDNDGVEDALDECPTGAMNPDRVDVDFDGCDDVLEDTDIDGDLVPNHEDLCPDGAQYWNSFSIDHDGDGCRDMDEDDNDDNDPYLDVHDDCPTGLIGWTGSAYDHDSDGCHDHEEDLDDDNDGVLDREDSCAYGMLDWTSNEISDQDGDGCNDVYEDTDVDDDGVPDHEDSCLSGKFGWVSTPLNDWDGDGCHDTEEDEDDDGDGFLDSEDSCIRSSSPHIVDADLDGCDDRGEDTDLDNDGIESSEDNCEINPLPGWVSSLNSDRDRDGCADATEDLDDDGDGVLDVDDACPISNRLTIDHDSDGCMDEYDLDDDNDGVPDTRDQCAHGALAWTSTKETDIDGDGCQDSSEDKSLPRGLVQTISDSPVLMAAISGLALVVLLGTVLQRRSDRRSRDEIGDDTRDVMDSMRDEDDLWAVKTETIQIPTKVEVEGDSQYLRLVETGYSPEVARAIVASEDTVRKQSEE
ncbi:MAG: hypothetical protein NZ780_04060 [Candidatus Poseidoniales archaeon]|nr:hypothetical protein [Candidatus Poseidoniales archaeon]